jgi:hypothetical protein
MEALPVLATGAGVFMTKLELSLADEAVVGATEGAGDVLQAARARLMLIAPNTRTFTNFGIRFLLLLFDSGMVANRI